ncbi:hypothetical protein QUA42_26770 [Microcoleus sp. Pol11C2]|uniref:hypothetical protein n=1 Tax=Microcoleus sp. Pol11C2 TaxID=3055389 RepID=UPI002FD0C1CB
MKRSFQVGGGAIALICLRRFWKICIADGSSRDWNRSHRQSYVSAIAAGQPKKSY